MARELVHGTCVALGERAALLRGEPGSGKSDLALRFLALPAEGPMRTLLVSDDQVWAEAQEQSVTVTAPETIDGLMEIRGLGIVQMTTIARARLVLVCNLVAADQVPRMPPDPWDRTAVAGVDIPSLKLAPFEASAPLKLKMALLRAPEH